MDVWGHLMELIMLCGIPTSGKSTFVKTLHSQSYWGNAVVLSTDNYIQQKAEEKHKTYNEVFKDHIKEATANMQKQLELAILEGRDLIFDQTNLTRKTRRSKTSQLHNYHRKTAVYFEISLEEALERNKHREGKFIPVDVLTSMYNSFEIPDYTENFTHIERGN